MKNRFFGLTGCLVLLFFLPFRPVVFGQEKLEVTLHLIRVNQGLREEKTFYYGVIEELEIENRSPVLYQDDLIFWVGEGEDLKAVVIQGGGNDVSLETKLEEGLVYVKLKEKGVFIQPGEKIRVGLDYKVFFIDDKKEERFDKKILYSHAQESLQFKVNSIENLGFRPQLEGFPFKKDEQESGWFISPVISPQPGDVYRLRITQEDLGEQEAKGIEEGKTSPEETLGAEKGEIVEGEGGREPIIVAEEVSKLSGRRHLLSSRVGEWSWKEMLAIFLLNDILVFGLIGWKCGWFKDSGLGQLFSVWQQLREGKRKLGKRKGK